MPIQDLLEDINTPESLQALEEALAQEDLSVSEFSSVLDTLQHVARDANVKIIVGAFKALRSLVTASPEHLGERQMATVCSITIDRIGDMKIQVRDSACQVLQTLLRVLTVPAMLERLDTAFNHRNHKVRQSVNELISAHLQQHGLADMSSQDIDKDLLPRLVSALSDSQLPVRSASQDALAVLYSFMGEELQALLKRHSIRPAQMRELQTRFDRAAGSTGMMESESSHIQSQTQPLPTRPKSAGPPRKSVPSSRINTAPQTLDTESVQAANMASEAELTSEINNISRELGPKVDWEKRIAALKQLQSVAMGAGAFPNFPDLVRLNLREQLTTQIQDRRSQVGRAACAALQACCETSGQRFEPLAIGLLPELFKLLVISIVVVAEGAHTCMTTIVQLCHSSRMLKGVVEALLRDKSPKLRQRCAEYLHLMLQHWPHTVLSRDVTLISSGVTKAVQDASPEARQVGRVMFMTFAQLFPENVNGVLKNVEHSLAIKLRRQVSTGTTTNSSPVPSPNGSFTTRRPSTAPGGASPATSSGPGRSVRLGASAGPVARRPNKLHTAPSEHGGSRPPSVSPKPAAVKSRSSVGGSRLFSESSTLSNNSMSSNALSLEGALLKYDRAKNSNETLAWSTAVSLCEGVMHALERTAVSGSDCRSMLRPNMSSLKVMIKDGLERNHSKVQIASLELFSEAFLACPALFEEPLMELLPPTLVLCNARNQQAQTKAATLRDELGRHLPAAYLCPAIVHSIRSAKLWYVKSSAYDLFVDHVGLSQPAGVPTDSRVTYAVAVEAVEHVTNSMPEMRQAASKALAAVYTFSPESVVKAVCALNSANAKRDTTVQAVQDAIPGFLQDLQAHLFNHNSPERQSSRGSSAYDGARGSSPRGTAMAPSPRGTSGGAAQRSLSRDENSAPNRHSSLDSKVAHVEAVSRVEYGSATEGVAVANGDGGAAARGVSTMTMSDMERMKVTSERIDRLLASINNNPRNCGPALMQLKTAVRAVPEEVWQVKVQIVVSTAMKLLLLTYYEVLEDACRMLAELVKVRPALLQQILQPLADCLLDVYNGLPADRQPNLLKHIERTLDMMALHLDVHTLMQYYIEKFPSPTSNATGTATNSINCLRKLAVMARFTIMRCKNNAEHENDLLSLLPSLHTTMDTDCAAVRMRTTEMWVAAFSVLGSRLQPYMESLSTTQKRIVNLYISRMKPAELTQPEVEQSEVAVAN